jgi:2-keto-3-deoxy-L-fuconate dehydrogenase
MSVAFSLDGKVSVITGAGSGIGAATAAAFAKAGAIVYAADRDEAAGVSVVREIEAGVGRARFALLDITDEAGCRALAARVLSENGGRCDVLVNNAGVGHVGTVLTTGSADMDRLWAVNVKGAYYLSRAFLPAMVERRGGSIVNIASCAGLMALADRFAYITTKHAVVGMTKSMAYDLGPSQVRVNCICPGRVETPFVQGLLRQYDDPEKYRAVMVAPHALKRMARPDEIAAAALYLASDEAAFVTGSAMVIDGGYTAGKG